MFSPIGVDVFLAGVPNIAKGLNTTPTQIINPISALLLGNALGHLILGFFLINTVESQLFY